eukprot:TRINITY_DN656_c0_g1_i2.p1 TRINITY_DN656_c0_g1~~TRINITY_DN656_c0_g1_i2.p1  ORF type:complete len:473 (-),score=150.89 TRINITY_DN656_c0_g1_i2:959-2377(-)
MLALFETPAGYALFQLNDEGKFKKIEQLSDKYCSDINALNKLLSLKAFYKFKDTKDALKATSKLIKGKIPKSLNSFLQKNIISQEVQDNLAIADKKLGKAISEKLGIQCIGNDKTDELFRIIRFQVNNLLSGVSEDDLKNMTLGLAHGLSRYKLKFSTDKIDTMIIQAISLIEDLDRELNNYMMRLREWYGWHFPELGKIIADNVVYAKVVSAIGMRTNTANTDLSSLLSEELDREVKQAAELSMGSEISDRDEKLIHNLAEQITVFDEYRSTLNEYLKSRMTAVAPNLTTMVGELVGAKLISHAGSLVSLAKYPASTIQILGAEKSFFKALKTKHNTPKYGLIYQAAIIGQTPAKLKGKLSRSLAAKTSICVRVDALAEYENAEVGQECKEYIERKLRHLEKEVLTQDSKGPRGAGPAARGGQRDFQAAPRFNEESDFNLGPLKRLDKTFVKAGTMGGNAGERPSKRTREE